MDNSEHRSGVFEFGEFRLDADKRLLKRQNGEFVRLTPKVFDTLIFLIENRGRVVEKDELIAAIWPDTVVEENNLSQNISILRRVLGENRGEHRFIATIPGRGFKFVAEVVQIDLGDFGTLPPHPEIPEVEHFTEPAPTARSRTSGKPFFVLAGIALSILAAFVYYYYHSRNTGDLGNGDPVRTIAVLPFKPLVLEDRDEALEMGMADTLIAQLSNNRNMVVRPLSSVRKFGGMDQDAQSAGRELGVESVLDGSIQRSDEKIRVTVRLTDVANGSSIWSGTYDEKFTDILSIQDLIAGKVAEVLKLKLRNGRDISVRHRTTDPEAYRLYLQGRYYSQKITAPEVRKGIEFFQHAVDADPTYALAYAGMADAYRSLPINSDVPSADAFPKAKAAAAKAIEIDPDNENAHIVLGWIGFWFDHDWTAAEREFKLALESDPNNADTHRGYSVMLTCLGRHQEAIEQMKTARDLDPLSLITGALEGQSFLFAGRYDESLDSLNKTLEVDPNFWVAHIQLSRLFIQQGKFKEAIAEAEKAKQFSGGNSEGFSLAGYAAAKSGNVPAARAELQKLKEMSAKGTAPFYNTAMLYNGLGMNGEAIDALQQAFAASDVRLILLKVDPKWDGLRSDPQFIDLMKRMNFE